MNPAEELAALKAVQYALTEQVKAKEVEVDKIRKLTGAKSFDTRFGPVTVTKRKPSLQFDDDSLLEWAQINAPHEVETITRVRDTLRKTLADRFTIDGDDVIDTQTGETVEWARAKPGSEYVTVRLTTDTKADAAAALGSRMEQVAELLGVE